MSEKGQTYRVPIRNIVEENDWLKSDNEHLRWQKKVDRTITVVGFLCLFGLASFGKCNDQYEVDMLRTELHATVLDLRDTQIALQQTTHALHIHEAGYGTPALQAYARCIDLADRCVRAVEEVNDLLAEQ